MRVVQAGNDTPAFKVNHFGVRSGLIFLSVIHANDAAVLDGDVCRFGIFRVERGDASVVENEIGKN